MIFIFDDIVPVYDLGFKVNHDGSKLATKVDRNICSSVLLNILSIAKYGNSDIMSTSQVHSRSQNMLITHAQCLGNLINMRYI